MMLRKSVDKYNLELKLCPTRKNYDKIIISMI